MRAETLAEQFAIGVDTHSRAQRRQSFKKLGIPTVGARQLSPRMQRQMELIIKENVNLIQSIPKRYFKRINEMLLQSVTLGYDSGRIYRELLRIGGITKRHAALIARDQNNKANSSLSMMRDLDAGIEKAIWVHSLHWKTEPRESHLEAGREELVFDLAKGAMLENENGFIEPTWPGQKINCKCTYIPVIDWGE